MKSTPKHLMSNIIFVGTLLACVAGIVNAVGFIAFGGFVTHVSGNATRAAVEYSEGHILVATVFLFGTLFFMGGACLTTLLMRGQPIETRSVSYGWPLLTEAFLIACVAIIGAKHLEFGETLEISRAADTWYIYTLTFAMGMQNAIIRHASGIIIRTTHMTGIVTDVGIAVGTVLSRLGSHLSTPSSRNIPRVKNKLLTLNPFLGIKALYESFHIERFFLNLTLLISFLTGAVLGTFGYLRFGFRVLSGPLVVLVVIAVCDLVSWKKRITENGYNIQSTRECQCRIP